MAVRVPDHSRLRFVDLLLADGVEFWEVAYLPEIPEQDDDIVYQVQGGLQERLDRLATRYYGDPKLWWVIAVRNDREIIPTDFSEGDIIIIPSPRFVLSSSADRFDFSNPFISAAIVYKNDRFPLWMRLPKERLANLGHGLRNTRALAFVQEISIEIQLAHLPIIQVQLTPPYRDAINFLDSELMEWGNSVLEVQFGYISNTSGTAVLSAVYSGILLKPEVSLGSDVTITLNAQGVGGFSAVRQSGSRTFVNATREDMIRAVAEGRTAEAKTERGQSFAPNTGEAQIWVKTANDLDGSKKKVDALLNLDPSRLGIGDFDIAIDALIKAKAKAKSSRVQRAIAERENQLRARRTDVLTTGKTTIGATKPRDIIVDTSDVTKEADAEAYRLLKEERLDGVTQGGQTDWTFIWKMASEAQCFLLWDVDRKRTGQESRKNILHIFPRNKALVGDTKRTFRLYDYPRGVLGPAASTFPILSASSPNMHIYLSASSRGLFMSDVNSETGEIDRVLIGDDDAQVGRTHEGGGTPVDAPNYPSTDPNTGDGATKFPGSPVDGSAVAQAKAEFASKSFSMGINLTVESFADPHLFPGDVIEVRGLGQRIDKGRYAVYKQRFTLGSAGSTMSIECFSNEGKGAEG